MDFFPGKVNSTHDLKRFKEILWGNTIFKEKNRSIVESS